MEQVILFCRVARARKTGSSWPLKRRGQVVGYLGDTTTPSFSAPKKSSARHHRQHPCEHHQGNLSQGKLEATRQEKALPLPGEYPIGQVVIFHLPLQWHAGSHSDLFEDRRLRDLS
ncbi:hypothetical protein [Cupriavidus sp. D39]|uniref:hypothetical protein n=1 Tax=Cupriavidus sp. D39 TaxID=2997877 RepID=UPI00226D66D2|nr:hypothetical protein [Cupriavidus sp. D39]MCY0852945.1 hypothetical protein [Cupriavidus sp. D39]